MTPYKLRTLLPNTYACLEIVMSIGLEGWLTFDFESEIIGQVAAFMVASKKPECIGIPDLQ
jgi:hypothetical protein